MTQYQVTAACVVHIPTMTASGPALGTYYRDAILPDGVPQDRIDHLLSAGMIQPLGGPAPAEPLEKVLSDGVQTGDALTVNSRSNKADLVEYGVAHDGDRAELDAMTVKELQALYLKGDQPE